MSGMTDLPLFTPRQQREFSEEERERIAIMTESGLSDEEAERYVLRQRKIERFCKNNERRSRH